ncbi:hypothetical protein [Shimia ponticola]|uniref:hypothetical protein n=1 Tax=Shimia ponticola TaxID=2582893 RepID=UPI0011BDE2C6|nr:hypothetical protein [Shimia ponticola]
MQLIYRYLLLFGALALVPGLADARALYQISQPKFGCFVHTASEYRVDCETTPGGTLSRSELNRNVHAYVVILGGAPAIEFLEENGYLRMDVTFWLDGRRYDTVDFGIKPNDWLNKRGGIMHEFQRDGFFTWRVRILTQKTWGEELELVFEDERGQRVAPLGVVKSYSAVINFED